MIAFLKVLSLSDVICFVVYVKHGAFAFVTREHFAGVGNNSIT